MLFVNKSFETGDIASEYSKIDLIGEWYWKQLITTAFAMMQ
jgi:hypothetical protein